MNLTGYVCMLFICCHNTRFPELAHNYIVVITQYIPFNDAHNPTRPVNHL